MLDVHLQPLELNANTVMFPVHLDQNTPDSHDQSIKQTQLLSLTGEMFDSTLPDDVILQI